MSILEKNTIAKNFLEQYVQLNESKKELFSNLSNKLLNNNFIYGQLASDEKDYYGILEMREILENYFSIVNFQIMHDDTKKIFYLDSNIERSKVKLRKLETVVLILLRRFYYIKSKENVDSNVNIAISIEELISSLQDTGIFKDKLVKTQIIDGLRVLKKYKLINFEPNNIDVNNVIEIYPTINLVVKINAIDALNSKLISYKNQEENDNYEDE